MKLPLHWLTQCFTTAPNWQTVWDKLTNAGIEIENLAPVAPNFSGIVVAQVIECIPHPDADKLKICTVDAGTNQMLQIVCGAPNVKPSIKVPCALIGAVLPNGLAITERKMRGVTSYGMLCSGEEVGIDDKVDGLLILDDEAPIGKSLREHYDLDEMIVEFKITPNRGDCLSVLGISREIAALTDYELVDFSKDNLSSNNLPAHTLTPNHLPNVSIASDALTKCYNYSNLAITSINNQVVLPKFITNRLLRAGFRMISPVVDITNYVMLELGQPLHGFDLDKIGNKLLIRMATLNETINLLADKTVTLSKDTLVICDSNNKPCAIAGVMGDKNTGVSANSTNILLESAFFTPEQIAGKARYYGVSSDSAMRFERGVDYLLQHRAITYAAALIIKYCGGTCSEATVHNPKLQQNPTITLDYSIINKLCGNDIPHDTVTRLLKKLGFTLNWQNNLIAVTAPSYRFDIKIAVDVIEEIIRTYGYDNISPTPPVIASAICPLNRRQEKILQLKNSLVTLGFNEIISYAFIEEKFEKMLGNKDINAVKLQNPIANLALMKTSLLADLVKTLTHNLNYGHKDLKIFTVARVFNGENDHDQPLKIAGLIFGNKLPITPNQVANPVDFYDLKHIVEVILSPLPKVRFSAESSNTIFHSGQCAKICSNNREIGIIGALHPKLAQELGLNTSPYIFELDLESVMTKTSGFNLIPTCKFQKVERDLAFLVANSVAIGDITDYLSDINIPYLISCKAFDIYNMGEQKSVAISFSFQADKTLVDDEINVSVEQIIKVVSTKFNATLRS